MPSKGNLDGDGHSAAVRRRRAPPPRDWLAQLNELIGAASRRFFQLQLVLRAASERDIRAQLPQLCAFASSICQAATASSEQRQAIRTALGDPQAQWLSRGAIESGASGFFCHLLLRETATIENDHASRCVVHILLEPVLKNCNERVVEGDQAYVHRACEWRFEKPKYYAMACANLWETLLPFLARAARQHPIIFSNVLEERLQTKLPTRHHRLNCRFAQVAGFWRLLEAVGDAKTLDQTPKLYDLLPTMLTFVVRHSVLTEEDTLPLRPKPLTTDALSDPHAKFYDLLMDKFWHDMHEFFFKCAVATRVTRDALKRVLHFQLRTSLSTSSAQRVRVAAFTAVACLFVKGLAEDTSELIKNTAPVLLFKLDDGAFLIIIGLVSHIESINVGAVLSVLHKLLDQYDSLADSPTKRRDILLWVIYVIVCRQQALDASANPASSHFTHLQERICAVDIHDLQLMPLHWMEIVWKVCVGMEDEAVDTFAQEARAFRFTSLQSHTENAPPVWEEAIQQVPSRRLDQYSSILAILGSPYLDSIKQTSLPPSQLGEEVMEKLIRKRRRLRRHVALLSEEHEETRQNTLLLPEVMARIASFMSAKRLCRLSLVCRAFASVTQTAELWKALYAQLVAPLQITCQHGSAYEHDWRLLYQAKFKAIKRMRSRQLAAARKAQAERPEYVSDCWFEDDRVGRVRIAFPSTQLCHECGCNQLCATSEATKNHRQLHEKYRCPQPHCREALVSATALKQHMKMHHSLKTHDPKAEDNSKAEPGEQDSQREKAAFQCTVSGCTRSYTSLKWLQNHIARVHSAEVPGGNEVESYGE